MGPSSSLRTSHREQATQRMLRREGELQDEGLRPFIPVPHGAAEDRAVGQGGAARDLRADKSWRSARLNEAGRRSRGGGETVEAGLTRSRSPAAPPPHFDARSSDPRRRPARSRSTARRRRRPSAPRALGRRWRRRDGENDRVTAAGQTYEGIVEAGQKGRVGPVVTINQAMKMENETPPTRRRDRRAALQSREGERSAPGVRWQVIKGR